MRVRLLGGLGVDGLAERELGSRKGRRLLKVLALARGVPVPVDVLAEILWAEDAPARPGDQIGVLVSRLRSVLGTGRLPRSDVGYALLADWLDVDEVAALAASATAALAEGRLAAARAAVDAALALDRGPLLPDEDGPWVEAERAAAAAALARVRAVGVDAAAAAGDHAAAAALGESALARDPFDEVVLRAAMRAHLAAGRPASALAAYARVRERLAEDLGVPPTAETEAVHAAALVAADGDRPAATAATAPRSIVGRDAELVALERAASTPGVVVVRGPAGIGKSTLVEAWSAGRGALVGRCDALGRDLPLQPVADALARHLGTVGAEAAAALLGEEAAALAVVLGTGGAAVGPPAAVDASGGEARLFEALLDVVERATPVLVVEDLHDAGRSTLAWLAYAGRRARRLVVVVTARPGSAAIPGAATVEVGPLGVEALARLVGADRAAEVHDRTGGHPLLLAAGEGGFDAAASTLGEPTGSIVRAAAVLGEEVDVELLAAVLDQPAVELLEPLEAAAGAGLLVERGAGFALRHALVREALEAGVGAARRALLHRRAAMALAARPRPDALAVAVHAREGGDAAMASRWFTDASALALARFDAAAAAALADEAVGLDPSAVALAGRARLRMALFQLDAAADDAARAVAAGGGAPALEVAGWIAYYRRRADDARAFADEAAAATDDPVLRASCLALAGRIRHGAGDVVDAAARLEDAASGPAAARAVGAVWLAGLRLHQGRPADALAALDGVALDAGSAHPFVPLHGRFARVIGLASAGRIAPAAAAADELVAFAEGAGALGTRFVGVAANVRGWVRRFTGDVEAADDDTVRGLAATSAADGVGPVSEAMSEPFWVGRLDLADGRLVAGDPDGAAALAATLSGMDSWGGTMAWHQHHRRDLLRARLALLDGRRDEAEHLAAGVRADAAVRGARRYEVLAAALEATARGRGADVEALAPVVEGLRRCAGLDGWRSLAELAAATGVEAWRVEAERWRADVRTRI